MWPFSFPSAIQAIFGRKHLESQAKRGQYFILLYDDDEYFILLYDLESYYFEHHLPLKISFKLTVTSQICMFRLGHLI